MNIFVLTIKKGCCNVCAETEILGVFTRIGLVNRYIREHTIYGMTAQFISVKDIELDDADHGVVVLSITRVNIFEDAYDTDTEKCKRMLRTTMQLICEDVDKKDYTKIRLTHDEPDNVGCRFAFGTIVLLDDGPWRLE